MWCWLAIPRKNLWSWPELLNNMIWRVLLLVVFPQFFYKLGQTSLVSWDEAWYAEVAKQFLHSGNWWVMRFNEQVFTDHPPVGFWLIALGQKIFGMNEFGSRAVTAGFGLLGLWGVYKLGREWYGKTVGFAAAWALSCAPWYLVRSRSGNLDIFLTVFMVWTIYFAWKGYFWRFTLCLALLFLTKTAAPFTILPALGVVLWGNWSWFISLIVAGGIFAVWMFANVKVSPLFFSKYMTVGLPGFGNKTSIMDNILKLKAYVHYGVGNWFRWTVGGMLGSVFFLKRKEFLVPLVLITSILGPMAFSNRAQIWHMIPAFPFLLLLLFGVLGKVLGRFKFLMIVFVMLVGVPQMERNWREIVDVQAYVSDEAILSRKASGYRERLYIGDRFAPAAVFYSGKQVEHMFGTVDELFKSSDANFLLIAKRYQMQATTVPMEKYEIIASDRDMQLVRFMKY